MKFTVLSLSLFLLALGGCSSQDGVGIKVTKGDDTVNKASDWGSSEVLRFTTSNLYQAQKFADSFPEYNLTYRDIEPGKILHSFQTSVWVTKFSWEGETVCEVGDPRLTSMSATSSTCWGIGNVGEDTYDFYCSDGVTLSPGDTDPCL